MPNDKYARSTTLGPGSPDPKDPVADQASADKAALDAKDTEKEVNATGGVKDGRNTRAGTPTGPEPGTLAAGDNNPQDGTPIVQPTGDVTRPDATKGPLHNPGVVVEPGTKDPSPTTVVAAGSVDQGHPKRNPTDPSRLHD